MDEETKAEGEVDPKEVNFLILRSLLHGPCRDTALQLMREMHEKKLLPSKYDWAGQEYHPDFGILDAKYAHVPPDFLCKALVQTLPKSPLPVDTLLGAGRFAVVDGTKGTGWKRHAARNRRPRSCLNLLERRSIDGRRITSESCPAEELYSHFRKLKTLRGHERHVLHLAYDQDSRFIITGSADSLLKVWSADSGYLRHCLRGHDHYITDLAVHPENIMIASSSADGSVRVWDTRTGIPIAVLREHQKRVSCLAFSPCPDRPYLVSGGFDGTCRLWNSENFNLGCVTIELPPQTHGRSRNRHRSASTNNNVASGSFPPGVEMNTLGSTANGTHSTVSGSPMMCIVALSLAFNSGGTRFVVGGSDFAAHVFQVVPGSPPRKPEVKHLTSLRGHRAHVDLVAFSHLGDRICTGSRDGTVRVWRRSRCKESSSFRSNGRPKRSLSSWTYAVLNMDIPATSSANSNPGANAGTSSAVIRPRRSPGCSDMSVASMLWSLDDSKIVASTSKDFKIRVWDSSTAQLLHSLDFHATRVKLDAHPFDRRILLSSSCDGSCALWDIESGKSIRMFSDPTYMGIAEYDPFLPANCRWSPNGLTFTHANMQGGFSVYGIGEGDLTALTPMDQFFVSDYAPLEVDRYGNVVDEETGLPPHLLPRGKLCDADMTPHPLELQPVYLHDEPAAYAPGQDARTPGTSNLRAGLIARAEEYRRREVEEDRRLAREAYLYARERARSDAIRRARREREMLETGTTSGNWQGGNPSPSVQRFIEALDTFDASDDSDSELDDPDWEITGDMRITRSAAARATTQENHSPPPVSTEGQRSRRLRPHPLREDGDGNVSLSESPTRFGSVTANEVNDVFSGQSRQNDTMGGGGSVDQRYRRQRPLLIDQRSRPPADVESDSPSVVRSAQVNTTGGVTPPPKSSVSQGRRSGRIGWTSRVAKDDQPSVADTESMGRSEVAEAQPVRGGPSGLVDEDDGHSVRKSEQRGYRRAFSSRSRPGSPTIATLKEDPSSQKKRKRQRRLLGTEGDESPEADTEMVDDNNLPNRSGEIVPMSTSSPPRERRSSRRNGNGLSRLVTSTNDQDSLLARTEIGSWRTQPADCVERRRSTLPDPVLDGEPIPLSASAWLHCSIANKNEYVPQVNDEVMYFPQGHQSLIEAEMERGFWSPDAADTSIPFSATNEPRLFQIVRINYRIPQCICTAAREKRADLWQNVRNIAELHLKPLHGYGAGENLFKLNYYPVDSVPEYLVLKSRVGRSNTIPWRVGEKFRMLFMDERKKGVYYSGHVSKIAEDKNIRPWNSIEVVWESEEDPDRGAKMLVSPWELEALDGEEQPPIPLDNPHA